MEYVEIQEVKKLSGDAIASVRVLLDYVDGRDINLYRHVYMCWDTLCNVQSSACRILNSRPVCRDRSNCKSFIEGCGCDNCDFRPF